MQRQQVAIIFVHVINQIKWFQHLEGGEASPLKCRNWPKKRKCARRKDSEVEEPNQQTNLQKLYGLSEGPTAHIKSSRNHDLRS